MATTNMTRVHLADGAEVNIETNLLRRVSGYFSASARFHENQDVVIHLTEVNPEAFLLFQKWLTDKTLSLISSWRNISGSDYPQVENTWLCVADKGAVLTKGIPRSIIDKLVDSWILSDYLIAPGFQNFVMDHISVCYRYVVFVYGFPLYNLEYIFKNTTEESNLRKYIVKGAFCSLSPMTLTEAMSNPGLVPNEMSLALACVGLAQRDSKSKAPWDGPKQLWHLDVVDHTAVSASQNP